MKRSYLLVALMAVIGLAAYYHLYVRGKKDDGPRTSDHRRQLTKPAMGPVPQQLPMVGAAGNDAFGYPRRAPDRAGFLVLLYNRKFAALDKYISSLQAEFEADFRKEYWPVNALYAFDVADPALTPIIDDWIRKSPKSFAAHAARGLHLTALGWHARGHGASPEVTSTNMKNFLALLGRARPALEQAVRLRPKLVAVHSSMIGNIGATAGPDKLKRDWLDDSIKRCPECVWSRRTFLNLLKPRWGGSYAAMDAFIAETRTSLGRNPRLAELAAMPHLDRCDIQFAQKNLVAAETECNRAQALAPGRWHALYQTARIFITRKNHAKALGLLNRALAVDPQIPSVLRSRAVALYNSKKFMDAAQDMLKARRIAPMDSSLSRITWLVMDGLRYFGHKAYKAKRDKEAIAAFRLGNQLVPGDPNMVKRLAFAQARRGIDGLREEAAAQPNNFELHRQLDYALAAKRKFAEVVTMWTKFIASNPGEARAYMERGGAYMHLRNRVEMSKDAIRACDMGLKAACNIVKRMSLR